MQFRCNFFDVWGDARFFDVYVLRIFILGSMRGREIASLKKSGDQPIAVKEKTSDAVEPANLAKDWLGPRGRETENLLHESEAALRSNDT
jgi:hypothetical protein